MTTHKKTIRELVNQLKDKGVNVSLSKSRKMVLKDKVFHKSYIAPNLTVQN